MILILRNYVDQQKNDKIIRQLWPLVILAIIMAFKLITLPIASKMSGLAARCQEVKSLSSGANK